MTDPNHLPRPSGPMAKCSTRRRLFTSHSRATGFAGVVMWKLVQGLIILGVAYANMLFEITPNPVHPSSLALSLRRRSNPFLQLVLAATWPNNSPATHCRFCHATLPIPRGVFGAAKLGTLLDRAANASPRPGLVLTLERKHYEFGI
jgi:hypothetical protein